MMNQFRRGQGSFDSLIKEQKEIPARKEGGEAGKEGGVMIF